MIETVAENLIIDPQLLRKFDRPGPRYTSYPTADRFVEAYGPDSYRLSLEKRTIGGLNRPLSLYVHLPFCSTICYYCACNKVITKDHGRSAKYIRYLGKEMNWSETCSRAASRSFSFTGAAVRRRFFPTVSSRS